MAEQRDLDRAVVDERLHLGENVARPAVLLLAAERGDDAKRARVVAADRDRHPPARRGVRRFVGSVEGNTSSASRISTCASSLCRARSSSVGSEPMLWVPNTTSTHGAFSTMSPWSFCARPAADGDLHAALALDRCEHAEVAVELVCRVLAHGARVDHVDVCIVDAVRSDVAGRLRVNRTCARSRARSSGNQVCAPCSCGASRPGGSRLATVRS